MLVLSRHTDESVAIEVAGIVVKVMVTEVRGNRVYLGFEGPLHAKFIRSELIIDNNTKGESNVDPADRS